MNIDLSLTDGKEKDYLNELLKDWIAYTQRNVEKI
ncbi:hypothetical protein QF028_001361 [Neobacillus sp. B4I6]|jgi:hypothetical protein